ncbi:MAG: hypothetical protein M1831_007179 [Alyxoria varia]|nr:MAG: hypothetical protein M1831_007179 [Alyxoria varia]
MSLDRQFEDREVLYEKLDTRSSSPPTSRRKRWMLLPNTLTGPFKAILILTACVCTVVFFTSRQYGGLDNFRKCLGQDCSTKEPSNVKPVDASSGSHVPPKPFHKSNSTQPGHPGSHGKTLRKGLVLASYANQDVSWMDEIDPVWEVARYVADDPNPNHQFIIPRNQGREAMPYLTYIIDHYDDFPDVAVFAHGHLTGWHQPEKITSKLRALNASAVKEEGYLSLRCNNIPYCSGADWDAFRYEKPPSPREGRVPHLFETLFPDGDHMTGLKEYPKEAHFAGTGQFVVSREAVHQRTHEEWKRFRAPLTRDLFDFEGFRGIDDPNHGYVFGLLYELMWHIFFGKVRFCPGEDYCRKVFFQDAIRCDWYPKTFSEWAHDKNKPFNCVERFEEVGL